MSDGCTCTILTGSTPWEPAEWEQADDCPVHPLAALLSASPASETPTDFESCPYPCANRIQHARYCIPASETPGPGEGCEVCWDDDPPRVTPATGRTTATWLGGSDTFLTCDEHATSAYRGPDGQAEATLTAEPLPGPGEGDLRGEVERLRAPLELVGGIHGRNAWNPDTKWPTDLAREWHNGFISCAAEVSIKARAALDPVKAAEDDALWRSGSTDTDSEWWQRTGHCGHCGTVASSCDCDGTCGCWEDHGPPLTPWRSLPAKLADAEAERDAAVEQRTLAEQKVARVEDENDTARQMLQDERNAVAALQDRLDKIAEWHRLDVDEHGGNTGDCNECGMPHPCATHQWATDDTAEANCTWDLDECEMHDHSAALADPEADRSGTT